jgi:hypothetical protein
MIAIRSLHQFGCASGLGEARHNAAPAASSRQAAADRYSSTGRRHISFRAPLRVGHHLQRRPTAGITTANAFGVAGEGPRLDITHLGDVTGGSRGDHR